MRVSRWWYAGATLLTIACGLGSRQWVALPSWVGDLLWATMVFFVVSILGPDLDRRSRAAIALTVSWLVELTQLVHADWIDRVRATTVGHLVLGQGFDWADLVAYAAGVGFAVLVDIELAAVGVGRDSSGGDQPAGDRLRDR